MEDRRLFADLTPASLAALCPELTIGRGVRPPGPLDALDAGMLEARGWTAIDARDLPARERIADAIHRLDAAALPLGAVYVFDEVWQLGAGLASLVSDSLGTHYALQTDFWAFRVPPGEEGWLAHRGTLDLLDRKRPELLNIWVALSDAELGRSCMHLVPLDDDPAYLAGQLHEQPVERAVPAPVAAGAVLVWNANVLHWGGACASDAPGPRVSITFTLARDAAPTGCLDDPTGWGRIDALADQILAYSQHAGREAIAWARLTGTLRGAVGSHGP